MNSKLFCEAAEGVLRTEFGEQVLDDGCLELEQGDVTTFDVWTVAALCYVVGVARWRERMEPVLKKALRLGPEFDEALMEAICNGNPRRREMMYLLELFKVRVFALAEDEELRDGQTSRAEHCIAVCLPAIKHHLSALKSYDLKVCALALLRVSEERFAVLVPEIGRRLDGNYCSANGAVCLLLAVTYPEFKRPGAQQFGKHSVKAMPSLEPLVPRLFELVDDPRSLDYAQGVFLGNTLKVIGRAGLAPEQACPRIFPWMFRGNVPKNVKWVHHISGGASEAMAGYAALGYVPQFSVS